MFSISFLDGEGWRLCEAFESGCWRVISVCHAHDIVVVAVVGTAAVSDLVREKKQSH